MTGIKSQALVPGWRFSKHDRDKWLLNKLQVLKHFILIQIFTIIQFINPDQRSSTRCCRRNCMPDSKCSENQEGCLYAEDCDTGLHSYHHHHHHHHHSRRAASDRGGPAGYSELHKRTIIDGWQWKSPPWILENSVAWDKNVLTSVKRYWPASVNSTFL